MSHRRFSDPIDITAEDIAWFHGFHAVWNDCETGAPALVAGDMELDDFIEAMEDGGPTPARYEKAICAFFLHARFEPGTYALRHASSGATSVTVSADQVALLKGAHWKQGIIDCKRPYGDYTHFEIEMAKILGLPVGRDDHGRDTLSPEVEKRLAGLHRDMLDVVQAYVEHAELEPGAWFVPYDGFEQLMSPRCAPLTGAEIATYRSAMLGVEAHETAAGGATWVVGRLRASALLFTDE
ncbi:MAG: hypothetical protein LWW93_09390 [Hyphomicrobiales bacterium]|nr:hypothetical protein [Hyphomicrobiales bacterium]